MRLGSTPSGLGRNITSASDVRVLKHHKRFLSSFDFRQLIQLAPDDKQPGQPAKQLLCHMAMVMRVIPKRTRWMIGWQGKFVGQTLPGGTLRKTLSALPWGVTCSPW